MHPFRLFNLQALHSIDYISEYHSVLASLDTIGAISSVIGLFATLIGLGIAIYQIFRIKSTAQATLDAARAALSESRKGFQRYCAIAARNLIELIGQHIHDSQLDKAAILLNYLAKHTGDLAYAESVNTDWIELTAEAREWHLSLQQSVTTGRPKSVNLKRWNIFFIKISTKIDELAAGLPLPNTEN